MWDGEDEDVSDIIEEKLSIVQWVSSGALIISYFSSRSILFMWHIII